MSIALFLKWLFIFGILLALLSIISFVFFKNTKFAAIFMKAAAVIAFLGAIITAITMIILLLR